MKYTITDAGRQAAIDAAAGGYSIDIDRFAVGSGFGYVPNPANAAFQGNQLYIGPLYFASKGLDGQINWLIRMGLEVGTFDFGEVALVMKDGTFFAIGTMETRYRKTKTTTDVAGNIVEVEAAAKLIGANPTITFSSVTYSRLPEVGSVNNLQLPSSSTEGNAYLTQTTDNNGNSIFAVKANGTKWTFPSHMELVLEANVEAVNQTQIQNSQMRAPKTPLQLGEYLVHFIDGNWGGHVRVVNVLVDGALTWVDPFPGVGPQINTRFRLLRTSKVPDVIKQISDLIAQGNVYEARKLQRVCSFAISGDVDGGWVQFDGTQDVNITVTLDSVMTPGIYTKIQCDAKGRVVGGTTLSISDVPDLPASKITSGMFPTWMLGSGGTNSEYVLVGNSTWRYFGDFLNNYNRHPTIWAGTTTQAAVQAAFADDNFYQPGTIVAYRGTGSRTVYGGNGDHVITVPSNTLTMKTGPNTWIILSNFLIG